MFKMKVFRASMTLGKTVLCLNVYLTYCSDTLQNMCISTYIITAYGFSCYSPQFIWDGSVLALPLKGPNKSLAEYSSSILPTDAKPGLEQLWRRCKCYQLIYGGLKYISGNVLKICFQRHWCGGVSKYMLVKKAISTELNDFNVIFTLQNGTFNLPSASLEFRNAAGN